MLTMLASTLFAFLPSARVAPMLHSSCGYSARLPSPALVAGEPVIGVGTALAEAAQASKAAREAGSCPVNSEKRSVLILGWFFAAERELQYVERLYKKNGYDEVVIQPSRVGIVSKPRGWYRSIRKQLTQRIPQLPATLAARLPGAADGSTTSSSSSSSSKAASSKKKKKKKGPSEAMRVKTPAELDRHFDVVHCLSGGFLALYVLLRSGIGLRFSTLLCDSTPILPKPAAFTRFARAYMESVGLSLPLRLLPQKLHQKLVEMRWGLSIFYINLSMHMHKLMRKLGLHNKMKAATAEGRAMLNEWQSGPVSWGLAGDFDRVSRHALGTIFEGAVACEAADMHFVYNPDDPFIDPKDVGHAADLARQCGITCQETHVGVDHVKTLFAVPKTIFTLLDGSAQKREELFAAGKAPTIDPPNYDVIDSLVRAGHLPGEGAPEDADEQQEQQQQVVAA